MDNKKDPKKYILPHSEAKLDFYDTYLRRYLRILYLSPYIKNINIFDLFCGTGIYQDGKEGSPIIAFKSIKNIIEEYKKKIFRKEIALIINDGEVNNIENVKSHLDEMNVPKIVNIHYNSYESDIMFSKVITYLTKFGSDTRNLLFIDPYGYKEIHKGDFHNLLKKGYSEIILFLPISQMHRFKGIAIRDFSNPKYQKLREFIFEFFPDDHPLRNDEEVYIQAFMHFLKEAFSFGNNYFTTSYYIQRDKVNFNALFFISSNIYGMEKILEVKWELDSLTGKGYSIGQDSLNNQILLPGFQLDQFERELKSEFQNKVTISNLDLYEFTIKKEHLPKHTNQLLKKWQNEGTLKVTDVESNKPARKNSFYISYEHYKSKIPKVNFNLK